MNIELKGGPRLKALLTALGTGIGPDIAAGMFHIASKIMAESQQIVPFDTGHLASTGIVHPPSWTGSQAIVELSYGTPYALIQHERLDYRHAPGRQAKYLSEPVERAAATFGAELSDVVLAAVRKRGG